MNKQYLQDFHKPVMLTEVLDALQCTTGKTYVDCTVGGAGHSESIASAIQPEGKLICLDVDDVALSYSGQILKDYRNVSLYKRNFRYLPELLNELGIESVDGGLILDLGVSKYQLTSSERGFSFTNDSMLDMRMDSSLQKTAYDLINTLSETELSDILYKYGEERYSKRIARAIIKYVQQQPIKTTTQLATLVASVVPKTQKLQIHPATRVFQALRISVNDELNVLSEALPNIINLMRPGARLAVITFHSLEDRIVKHTFKYWASTCVCPPEIIDCRCNHLKKIKIITKKPIVPDNDELKNNPSSRSSKLRVVERL